MGEIFCNYSLGKGLISRIYEELHKLNIKRTSNLINKWTGELSRYVSKKEV
jgi:hypothetical protein